MFTSTGPRKIILLGAYNVHYKRVNFTTLLRLILTHVENKLFNTGLRHIII